MHILGINGGFRQGYQDVSACLIKDGKLIAAIEEERLNRIKFSGGRLPLLSIKEVLSIGKISMQDVDLVAFHGSTWGDEIDTKIRQCLHNHFGHAPAIKRFHHHDCHAAATFYSSDYDRALLLTMDNSGDGISVQVSLGENGRIVPVKRFPRPQSFGVFYSLITQYCGFTKDSDEYKLMGLSAFGDANRFDFSWLMDFDGADLKINTEYIVTVPALAPSLHRDEMNFNEHFIQKMGRGRRLPFEPVDAFYKDVAASAQKHLERVVLKLLAHYISETGIRKVAVAGGVALNCLLNQKIANADFVEELFVQPASSDAGISMGAAWLAGLENNIPPVAPDDAFLGNEFDEESILHVLKGCGVAYSRIDDPALTAAQFIAEGKVIAWFQKRMEFGPRALGNRSILANPATENIQSKVNQKIKFRESFRPFGASVLEEECQTYFIGKLATSPYMNINYTTRENYRTQLAGVTHADGTSRIQTVNEKQNKLYYTLLKHLHALTGVGVCLNTSFNLNHEPIVNTPQQAIASFFGCGLDALFLGNYLIQK